MKSGRDDKKKKIEGYYVDGAHYEHKRDFGKQGQTHEMAIRSKKKKPHKVYNADGSERDYFAKLVKQLKLAQRETSAQGVIRLFNPANPKTRLGFDIGEGDRVLSKLVMSQQVRGFRTLAQVIEQEGLKTVLQKINDGFDGKPGGYTGLGRVMILALLTSESDLHLNNIGIDAQGRFVKIDGDWTHARLRFKDPQYDLGMNHKFHITLELLRELPFLNNDIAYPYNWFDQIKRGIVETEADCEFLGGLDQSKLRNEMYQAILDIIVTPDQYFEMIYQRSSYNQDDVTTDHLEIMNSRMQLMHSALQSSDFLNYIKSDKAKAAIEKFEADVAKHKLAGKEQLATADEIHKQISDRFNHCLAIADMQPGTPNWNDACSNLIDTNIHAANIHGETHIMLAAAQGDQNLYGLLVQKGANELAVANYNETVLSMAASNGHEQLFNALFHKHKELREQKYLNAALLAAAQSGNINIVNTLLASGAACNIQDAQGNTPLMLAAKNGHLNIVNLLVSEHANAMLHNKSQLTALSFAALCGHEDIVKLLLLKTELSKYADNALLCACHGNNSNIINRLVQAGANIHAANTLGQTPIHILAIAGKIELMKNLLAIGATLDTRDKHLRTPLMNAVLTGNLKMVDFILSSPSGLATLNQTDINGDSALTLAIANKQWKMVVSLLKTKGINLSQQNYAGHTPLSLAYDKKKITLVSDLLTLGASPDTIIDINTKETLLFIYARAGNTDEIDKLVKLKCNLNHPNKDGDTALFAAIEAKNLIVSIHLLERKADCQAINKVGATLLAHAAGVNFAVVIPHLIAAGADINQRLPGDLTALTVAMLSDSADCVERLLAYGATFTDKDQVPKDCFDKTLNELLKRDRADLVFKLLSSCNALDYDLSFSAKGHNLLQIAVRLGDADLTEKLISAGVKVSADVLKLAKKELEYYHGDAKTFEHQTTDIKQKREDYRKIDKLLSSAHHKQPTNQNRTSTININQALSTTPQAISTNQPPAVTMPNQPRKGDAYFEKPAATSGSRSDPPKSTPAKAAPTSSVKKK